MILLLNLLMICTLAIVLVGLGAWPAWALFIPPITIAIGYGWERFGARRRP